ncbi:MAG: 50S ribosomal protein L30 [Thermoplasmata archaeon]
MAFLVVRVRGGIHSGHEIQETLRFLHLTRANHATVVAEAAQVRGMLHKVQGYVTWGEAEPETVELLLAQRGEAVNGAALTDPKILEELVRLPSLSEVTRSVSEGGLTRVAGIKPLFRLKAPKGGWKSTKKPFSLGGALGYRGRAVNDLVRRMV